MKYGDYIGIWDYWDFTDNLWGFLEIRGTPKWWVYEGKCIYKWDDGGIYW